MSLSVITVCFNNLEELKATCASVDMQTVVPLEHLVIDASSHNGILHWLETSQQPAYRRWIHERDEGISDGFNKGVKASVGTITHLLNAGDKYAIPEAIEKVMKQFESDTALMWLHSLFIQHRGSMDVVTGVPFDKNVLWKGMRTVAHPTMFIKREVYERHGFYRVDRKIAMDYDLLVRIRNEKNAFIEEPLVYFAPGGASDTQFARGLREVRDSYREHVGNSSRQALWQLRQRLLRRVMTTGVGKMWFRWKNRNNKA